VVAILHKRTPLQNSLLFLSERKLRPSGRPIGTETSALYSYDTDDWKFYRQRFRSHGRPARPAKIIVLTPELPATVGSSVIKHGVYSRSWLFPCPLDAR